MEGKEYRLLLVIKVIAVGSVSGDRVGFMFKLYIFDNKDQIFSRCRLNVPVLYTLVILHA